VYLTKPDLAPIIHAKMLSHGFGMPKTLTASLLAVITTFYKIAPKGLMKLPGLSLVRQVCTTMLDPIETDFPVTYMYIPLIHI
jgi:hypothetical protein